jgi:hypothetical protein
MPRGHARPGTSRAGLARSNRPCRTSGSLRGQVSTPRGADLPRSTPRRHFVVCAPSTARPRDAGETKAKRPTVTVGRFFRFVRDGLARLFAPGRARINERCAPGRARIREQCACGQNRKRLLDGGGGNRHRRLRSPITRRVPCSKCRASRHFFFASPKSIQLCNFTDAELEETSSSRKSHIVAVRQNCPYTNGTASVDAACRRRSATLNSSAA